MADPGNEQTSLTAAEYVLGTLDELEAKRFEADLDQSGDAQAALVYWENRLSALGLVLAPVAPPDSVWNNIAARLPRRDAARAATGRGDGPRVGLWRGLAIAACVAVLVMAALLFIGSQVVQPPSSSAPAYASVIYDKPSGASWLITAPAGGKKLSVVAMHGYNVPQGKMLRAWFKPDNGPPVLIGPLPPGSGKHSMKIPKRVAQQLNRPAQLVVSMEDRRYAGTPAPHGKVMWDVPIARSAAG